jgi:hypothetical protein
LLQLQSKSTSRKLYLVGLYLFAMGMPMSKPVVSIAQFLLLAGWLIEPDFKGRIRRTFKNPIVVLLSLGMLIQLLWIPQSEDLLRSFHDFRIKLPILAIPILTYSIWPLSQGEFRTLLNLFSAAVAAVAAIGFGMLLFGEHSSRDLSPFISHIRMGILCCLAILANLSLLRKELTWWRIGLIVFLVLYVFTIQSLTSIVILITTAFISAIWLITYWKRPFVKWSVISTIGLASLGFGLWTAKQITSFYESDPIDHEQLDYASADGSTYMHLENKQRENGHYIWIYVAMEELRTEWNKLGRRDFDSTDDLGQPLHSTLIRYMTSKNLRKDRMGFEQLSQEDIMAVESGITNVRFVDGRGFDDRLYETLWEIEQYQNGGNPEGNSVIQRIEFWKTGYTIFLERAWVGIGPGNLRLAFEDAYVQNESRLSMTFRKRAHNQYLTYLISFGLVGCAFILFGYFFASLAGKRHFLSFTFTVVWLLSFINEDTLETQIGVSFFIFFLCVYAFNELETENNRPASLPD